MRPMNSKMRPSAATPLIDRMIHEVVVFVQKVFGASSNIVFSSRNGARGLVMRSKRREKDYIHVKVKFESW